MFSLLRTYRVIALVFTVALCEPAWAQPAPQVPSFVSPEVTPGRIIIFRVYAPKAENVRVEGTDLPRLRQLGRMAQTDGGIWELKWGPVDPGAYRYKFSIDGATTLDDRNPSISESNETSWSLVYVPGAEFMDTGNVPHGSVSAVTYYSNSLQHFRRLHVYLPPGYETSSQKYPVLYLLHGAGDSDDSWTSVGRAGFILDNLIAARKAKPMIVVMPAGHTTRQAPGGGPQAPLNFNDDLVKDFEKDTMPMVETRYRIHSDRAHRAIAGLSMGGAHTLIIGIAHLDEFAYIGVFSSGLLGTFPIRQPQTSGETQAPDPSWEDENRARLENAPLKKGLKLFWFATGSDDFLIENTRATVSLFKKYGFAPAFEESNGGHTWINWRNYLNEFAPQLFR